jgi:tetratricopeptide (TPR) repeat protein|tara:strand:+ start:1623 stop:2180 length:558 start_codon:yes stop_codon:yes gene_type:complete
MRFFYSLFLCGLISALTAFPAVADQNDPKLDELFAQLRVAESTKKASGIEAEIWATWAYSGDELVDLHMSLGMKAMHAGALRLSLREFSTVIDLDQHFAEGWNKRATIYYMMGDYDKSVKDIERTLALEPRHYGAISGMALIFDATRNLASALKAWQQVLEFTPYNLQIRKHVKDLENEVQGKAI